MNPLDRRRPDGARLHLLGSVTLDGATGRVPLGGPRQRLVLALLAAADGRPVSINRLIADIWPRRAPTRPRQTVQVYVANLRAALRRTSLTIWSAGGVYRLVARREEVDAWWFADLVTSAIAGGTDCGQQLSVLERALALWDHPFADLLDADADGAAALQPVISSLNELHLRAEDRRLGLRLDLDGPVTVLGDLQDHAARHPLDDDGLWLLMLALYRAGRHGEALDAFKRGRRDRRRDLGVEPSAALRDLERRILVQDPTLEPAPPSDGQRSTSSPMPVRLHGRSHDLDRVLGALRHDGLVTVTGPAGVGKSALARAAIARLIADSSSRVAVCELAPAQGSEHVADLMASALGGRHLDSALAASGPDPLVVVVDDCEQVLGEAVAAIKSLRDSAPGIGIVATSRQALGLAGEVVIALEPLEAPAADDPASVAASPAVALFLERAGATGTTVVIDDVTGPVVAELCRRLDGLPLAIELAAGWAESLGPDEMMTMIDRRLRWLVDRRASAQDRHRGLEMALRWSYDALTPTTQTVFRHAAVFRGRFRAVNVHQLLPGQHVDAALETLVERGLLVGRWQGGERIYDLLDTVREFGQALLDRAGEARRARRSWTESVQALADQLDERGRMSWDRQLTLSTYLAYDDFRAALATALELDAPARTVFGLMNALWALAPEGHASAVLRLGQAVLARFPEPTEDGWAKAVGATSIAHLETGDWSQARQLAAWGLAQGARDTWPWCVVRYALGLAAHAGAQYDVAAVAFVDGARLSETCQPPAVAMFESRLAAVLGDAGRSDEAIAVGERARARVLGVENPRVTMFAEQQLGVLHLRVDRSVARDLLHQALSRAEDLRAVRRAAILGDLAVADLLDGDLGAAARRLTGCFDGVLRVANRPELADVLRWVACLLGAAGDDADAARLAGFTEAHRQWSAPRGLALDQLLVLDQQQTAEVFAVLRTEGAQLSVHAACSLARDALERLTARRRDVSGTATGLGSRPLPSITGLVATAHR